MIELFCGVMTREILTSKGRHFYVLVKSTFKKHYRSLFERLEMTKAEPLWVISC